MMKLVTTFALGGALMVLLPQSAMAGGRDQNAPIRAEAMTSEAENAQVILSDLIRDAVKGWVDYSRMERDIIPAVRAAQPQVTTKLSRLGEIVKLTYRGQTVLGPVRAHKFDVQHARGRSRWRISLTRDELISNIDYRID